MAQSMQDYKSELRVKVIDWRDRERAIRRATLAEPLYFEGNLEPLRAIHLQIATEFEAVLDRWGWPGFGFFDWDGGSACAEAVRSCWTQPKFMRSILPSLEQAFRFGEAAGEWFAKHYDTLMFLEKKPQVYGTFLLWKDDQTLVPWMIVDEADVDLRRKALLMPDLRSSIATRLEEYGWIGETAPRQLESYNRSLQSWSEERAPL